MNDFEDNATVDDSDIKNSQLPSNIVLPVTENKEHLCNADYSLHPDIKAGYTLIQLETKILT